MSHSKKKTKKSGLTTAESEKKDKQEANRKFRRVVKQKLKIGEEFPKRREVSNVWAFGKDGKKYDPNMREKELRK